MLIIVKSAFERCPQQQQQQQQVFVFINFVNILAVIDNNNDNKREIHHGISKYIVMNYIEIRIVSLFLCIIIILTIHFALLHLFHVRDFSFIIF